MTLDSTYTFTLPVGLLGPDGRAFLQGGMRPATALDEIEPLGDLRVRANEGFYGLLLLSRVVTWLGPYREVTPELLGALSAVDFAYLQDVYGQLNSPPGLRRAPAGTAVLGYQPQGMPVPGASVPGMPVQGTAQVIETECPHCHALLELDLGADLVGV